MEKNLAGFGTVGVGTVPLFGAQKYLVFLGTWKIRLSQIPEIAWQSEFLLFVSTGQTLEGNASYMLFQPVS